MLAIRSTPRVVAAAAAAVACLLLGACGASTASGSGTSSSGTSSPAPSKGLLTGDFCKDFNSLGKIVSHVSAAQSAKLDRSRPAAIAYLRQIAADFDGLGKEAPPKVEKFMHVIASKYNSVADAAASGTSLADLKTMGNDLGTKGASGAAFRQLITYVGTNCT